MSDADPGTGGAGSIPALSPAVPARGGRFTRALGRGVLSVMGWHFEGRIPDRPKFVAIVAPHTSNWDFVVALGGIFALGIDLRWIGKHTLFRRPFGGIMRWLGGTPVDRGANKGMVAGIVELFERHERFVVGLAPEGTRKQVAKWKTGFYHIAAQARVPILMISLDYARKRIMLGPTLDMTGEIEADMDRIKAFYADKRGKYA